MTYVETLAYFYRKHELIYVGLFQFVPELGHPADPLSISSAKIFLELVNVCGGDGVLDRWNKNQLAPLFAAQSLSALAAEKEQTLQAFATQVTDLQQGLRTASAQVAAKDAELKRITGSLGWRLLALYGKIKYAYLLPVYRLLHLMPRESQVTDEHQQTRDADMLG